MICIDDSFLKMIKKALTVLYELYKNLHAEKVKRGMDSQGGSFFGMPKLDISCFFLSHKYDIIRQKVNTYGYKFKENCDRAIGVCCV